MASASSVSEAHRRAKVEEKLMTTAFPAVYPSYKARTKMLIPFVL